MERLSQCFVKLVQIFGGLFIVDSAEHFFDHTSMSFDAASLPGKLGLMPFSCNMFFHFSVMNSPAWSWARWLAFLPIETSSVSKAEWLGQLHAVFFDLDGIWWLHRTHELHIRLSHVYFPSQTHPEKLCRKFSGLFQVPWCGETRGSSFGTWQAISNPERLRPSFVVRLIRTNVLQVSRKLDVLDCCAIS